MKDTDTTRELLEQKLCRLPDRRPPVDLKNKIMDALPRKREPWFLRLGNRLNSFLQGCPRPVLAAMSTACLVLTFYGGMQFERVREVSPSSPQLTEQPLTVNNIRDPEAYFFLGRSLLTADQPKEALVAFQRAQLLQPENPKYILWQGAASYALGDIDGERRLYRQLLRKRPDFLPARLNLANNFLQNGQFDQAGELYEQVLQYDPTEKTAMYNRALVLRLQGKKQAEALAWKKYLRYYRTGTLSYRALKHLHELGDYSYRRYQLGYRTVILNQDLLLAPAGVDRDREINFLARRFSLQPAAELNLVVFIQDNARQAKQIARSLRSEIIKRLPAKYMNKVRASWFGEPESMATESKSAVILPQGILVFSQPEKKQQKEERV